MKRICAVLLPAFVLAAITPDISHAQNGGYAVTERGANYRVLQKTTVEHGTNRVHRYTELATGLNYQNSYGQWTESKEEIDLQPNGGASAVQGQHQVYFPADIYDGVLEVVTPDGRQLRSRPLGVSYDDGSSTVFITTLTNSIGVLTASNQVTYPNAFTDIKADLVCTYRKSGFECDLVFREKPPTPDNYGLDPDTSTLQLVTEFFNTQDPQQIPGASDEWFGLQDDTLKFGKLTMTHGKAFSMGSSGSNSAQNNNQSRFTSAATSPVYKRWLHLQGRTFLIEELPLVDVADDLNTLPEAANAITRISNPAARIQKFASNHRQMPPAHEFVTDTKQMQIASIDINKMPGVVLDYDEVDSNQTNFTFQADTTYYVSATFWLFGTTTIEGGAVVKLNSRQIYVDGDGALNCETSANRPAIFTSFNNDSVGNTIPGSSGNPSALTDGSEINIEIPTATVHDVDFMYLGAGLNVDGGGTCLDFWNCQFIEVDQVNTWSLTHLGLHNVLLTQWPDADAAVFVGPGDELVCENVTVDDANLFIMAEGGTIALTNCIITRANLINTYVSNTVDTNSTVWPPSPTVPVYQTAANANYYLATSSPYRDAGTTNIDPDLLAEIQTMTTYAPQDGGWPDTNTPDLGYHYPVNEDSDYDGLPDGWEWKYFGSYTNSGTDLDSSGSTLLFDYENGVDLNQIGFTVSLGNQHFNTTNATGSFLVMGGVPAYEAVLVNDENFSNAVWSTYDGTVHLNLGATDGVYQVWIGLKGFATNAPPMWMGTTVSLDRVAPALIISNPTNNITAQPYLQVQGCAPESLSGVTYDFSNAVAVITNQPGQISGDQFFDTNTFEYTTNYFQCYDLLLTNGLNTITVHATDLAGNVTVTNVNVTLDYLTATNPVIKLYWPQDNTAVIGTNFTWRGWTEDASAVVMAQIVDTNNDTNIVVGMVERDGKFWVENLPLSSGTNWLTLSVTNAAGLSSATNIMVVQSTLNLTVNPVSDDLWLPTVTVNGGFDDFSDYTVWVNGVKAADNGDGTWTAQGVPLPQNGGTAVIQARAIPNSNNGGNGTGGSGGGPVSYDNLGNPDPPQDNDTEAGTADRPTEVVLDKAHWTDVTLDDHPHETEDMINDYVTGDYSITGGGTIHELSEDYGTNGVFQGEATIDWKYGPDKSFIVEHDDFGAGGTFDYTNGEDSLSIALALGTLDWEADNGYWREKRTSDVKYNLHIGGKAGAGQQVLVVVSGGSGTAYLTTPPFYRNIDYGDLTVAGLGKTLGSDGMAYGQSSVGATVSLNLTAPVAYHSFGDGAGVCQPTIIATGNGGTYDLSVTNPEFCVGQYITFGVSGLPPYANSVQHWTLPDTYVNESYPYSTYCTSYRKNADLLTNLTQQCWYVDKVDGGTVSVGMDLQFANGQTAPIAVDGKFSVFKPKVNWVGYPYSSVAVDTGYDGSGATYLHFGTTYSPDFGVYLTKQIINDGGFSGTYTPTQLRDVSELACGINGLSLHRTGIGLDVGSDGSGLSTHPDDANTYWDSPAIDCNDANNYVSVNHDRFRTFLMFQPTGGIPVPLKLIEWNWFGSADKTGGWHKTSGDGDVTTSNQDTTEFPVWANVINGSTGFTDYIDNNCQ